jgi:hypothetical protein
MRHSQGFVPSCVVAKLWRISCFLYWRSWPTRNRQNSREQRSARKRQLSLNQIKITPRDEQVLHLLMQGCSNKQIAAQEHQPQDGEATSADPRFCGRASGTAENGSSWRPPCSQRADEIMQPRERLTAEEMQVAALVWGRPDQPRDCQGHWHHRTGSEELPAQHLRQTGRMEPSGAGHLCCPARGREMAGRACYAGG